MMLTQGAAEHDQFRSPSYEVLHVQVPSFLVLRCFKSLADFRAIAKEASEKMQKEGGVEYAVEIIEEVLSASS